jgi:hypothetical protein
MDTLGIAGVDRMPGGGVIIIPTGAIMGGAMAPIGTTTTGIADFTMVHPRPPQPGGGDAEPTLADFAVLSPNYQPRINSSPQNSAISSDPVP